MPLRSARDRIKYLFLLPAVFWTLAFTIYPLGRSLWFSFLNYRLGRDPVFVGLDKFAKAFTDYRVLNSVKITLIYVLVAVAVEMILGMCLALLFTRRIRGQTVLRAILTLPLFATPIAAAYLALTIFYEEGGPLNSMLGLVGIKVPWLSDPSWALISILMLEIWQWTPFCFLVFLAGLHGMSKQIYEAVALDSTSQWQIFWRITFPMMQPVIIIVFLLRLIEAVKVFDYPFVLTKGGPGTATEVYSMFVYRTGLHFFDLGYASALAYLLLAGVMVIVLLFCGKMRSIYE